MRNPITALGGTEMEVLRHVWRLGRATTREVHDAIRAERRIAYTTVMTVMKNLVAKGYLAQDTDGTAHVYHAAKAPAEVQGSLLSGVLAKVFGGSPGALVQTLVQHETLTDADRAELRRLIDALDDDA